MSAPIDNAKAPRAGEELDTAALEVYLAKALPGEVAAGAVVVEQFPSGHSNLTYLIRAARPGGGDVELVLRRPPFGNVVKTAHDMGREHKILAALSKVWPKAPRPLVYCEDQGVLGAPFYVMERRRGLILRRKMPEGVFDEAKVAKLAVDFVDTLVELHEIPYRDIGLADLGKPEGYVERQVSGWTKRYEAAKTDDIPEVERAASWLATNLPASPAPTLIHNDFKYDNLVLDPADPTRVTAVLDWEMSTVGDPLMDLGTALAWWVESKDPAPLQQFAFGPTNVPGSPTRREIAEAYARARKGVSLDDIRFYYAFSLFKNAVVAQQIYARYKKGLTKDERFAAMIFGVRLLSEGAVRAIETGEL